MRLLHVYRDHFADLPGGIERHVHELARGMASSHEVEVVASARSPRPSANVDGVLIHVEREFARPGGVPLAPGIFTRVRDGYDVVHLHTPNPTGELACWMAHNKVPLVATYHADIDRGSVAWPVYRRLLHRVLSACGRVLVASDRLVGSSSVLSRLAEEPGLVEVVPFGVDTERFHPGDGATAEQGASLPIVLFVGRLRYYKGLPYLIEAVARTDARLVIAGDGRERARIESLGRTRLGDRFTLLPDVSESELADLYRSATMFSLPSTSSAEAFGLATLEAMASGLPVITTELGTATSEINVDGVTGLVVPPRDVDALTDALDQLLGDEALRRRMAQASRARVVERYERQQMLDRISGIYEQVRAERNLSGHG